MKTKKRGEKYISCLASNFKQPIANLIERLLKIQMPDFRDDPPRSTEVDYATTLVLLLVLSFEAWISRARFFDSRTPTTKDGWKHPVRWMETLGDAHLQPIIARLDEVYFLRDAIAHDHIWTYRQRWVQGRALYSDFDLDVTWQSSLNKVERFVRGKPPLPSFPRSKKLDLTIAPTFVSRRDVVIVFKTVKDALKILDERNHLKIVPKVPYVRFDRSHSIPFWSLIGVIQRSYLVRNAL